MTASKVIQSNLIVGTGDMADRIRNYPWHETPLGAIDAWPATLLDNVNLILNSSAALAIYWGPQMIFFYNDQSNRMIGPRSREPLGLTAPEVWGPNWHKMEARFEAVLSSATSFYSEDFPIRVSKGNATEQVFVDFSLGPIYHRGTVVGIFRALQETTDSVLAMRALAEANERLQMALTAGNGLGIWDFDIQSGIVRGDQALAKLYSLDPQLVAVGVSHLMLQRMLHPDDIPQLTDAIMDCILTGKQYTVEYRVRREDESYRWVHSKGRCIYDSNGHACRVTGFKTEMTEQPSPQRASSVKSPLTDAHLAMLPDEIRSFLTGTVFVLAESPDNVKLEVISGETTTQLVLHVAAGDLGKIIGKQGRTIRSIRTLLLAINGGRTHRYSIDVVGDKILSQPVN